MLLRRIKKVCFFRKHIWRDAFIEEVVHLVAAVGTDVTALVLQTIAADEVLCSSICNICG